MFLVSSCICVCTIHWSQVLNLEWKCTWSSSCRRYFNYIWVINFIVYWGATYIIVLIVGIFLRMHCVCHGRGISVVHSVPLPDVLCRYSALFLIASVRGMPWGGVISRFIRDKDMDYMFIWALNTTYVAVCVQSKLHHNMVIGCKLFW